MLNKHRWGYWQPPGANLPPVPVMLPVGSIELRQAVELPSRFDMKLQTWDMAFKGTSKADFFLGQIHAAHGPIDTCWTTFVIGWTSRGPYWRFAG